MKGSKVLVIGLDGATYDLIKPWANKGHLPTFQRLLREGVAGELQSTIPPMTAPAWTSFMTGKNPGKHGLFDWIQRQTDNYDVSPVTARQNDQSAIWDILGNRGKRVCAINVPMTFPPRPVNGAVIAGLPAPSKRAGIAYPKDLLEEIEREVGEYLLYPDPGQAYSDSGVDSFLERLYSTTERRLEVMDYLRAQEEWPFFMLVLSGTDTVQHAMWRYMSPEHPRHDPAKAEKYGDAILSYCKYVDQALGDIVAALDDDTMLVLMSDHGFGPFHKFIHVNNWLREQGWLKIKRSVLSQIKLAMFRLGFTPMTIYNLLMDIGLGAMKREVERGKGMGLLRKLFLSFDDVDWSQTTAYSLGNVGQIYLNVRGREPNGLVEPGAEYKAVRQEIIAQLREMRDPDTGEVVVQDVYRREEIYSGEYAQKGADIVFIPTRMEYFGFGECDFGWHRVIESVDRGISGTHRMNGMFLMWGGPVQAGLWLDGARIYDLAPTILHVMGEPVPVDMDGSVLVRALKPEYQEGVQMTEPSSPKPGQGGERDTLPGDDGLSEEEEALIGQRLRDLGYVA
jgi:predicted AlkP superfamily phosphohydrolase/phosphomutase